MTAILGFVWRDIRSFRKDQQEELKSYLPRQEHALMCDNQMLRMEKKLDGVKEEIIKEIKNNGR